MSKAVRRLKEQMEIEFLKSKTYTEINEMFNELNAKLNEAQSEVKKLNLTHVSKQRELLITFAKFWNEKDYGTAHIDDREGNDRNDIDLFLQQ